jgi:formylglycine-generating enzyme required for sulfatase activity
MTFAGEMKRFTSISLIAFCCFASCKKAPTAEGTPVAKLSQEVVIDLGDGVTMDFVLLRPGSFTMGSDDGGNAEKNPHKVTITESFYLGKYEVTQAQWRKVMGSQPSRFKGAENPVEQVGWGDCQEFLAKLKDKAPSVAFRLPTEGEWEYACRAGSTGWFCYGGDPEQLGSYAWFGKNAQGTTHPVGVKKPNAWGLYDMHGNVWEWCADWFGAYSTSATTNPLGPDSGSERVWRGGAWSETAMDSRCGNRMWVIPVYEDNVYRNSSLGFRVAMTTATPLRSPFLSGRHEQETEQDGAGQAPTAPESK